VGTWCCNEGQSWRWKGGKWRERGERIGEKEGHFRFDWKEICNLFGFGGFLVYVACGISVWFFWIRKVSSTSVCSHPEKKTERKTFIQVSKRFLRVLCFSLFKLAKLLKIIRDFWSNCTLIIIFLISLPKLFLKNCLLILITGNNLET